MNLPKYTLNSNTQFTRFEFVSEGPNGSIRKVIEFQAIINPVVFNLAFGDKDPVSTSLDDLAVSDNHDTERVLASVVAAIYSFLEKHPAAFIYAAGSTVARTRLFRMAITKYQIQVQTDFYLYGQLGDEFYNFEPGKTYEGFLAKRKFT